MIRMSPDLFCSGLGTFLLELIQTMIKYLFCTVAAILVLATACDRNNFPEVQTENRPIWLPTRRPSARLGKKAE